MEAVDGAWQHCHSAPRLLHSSGLQGSSNSFLGVRMTPLPSTGSRVPRGQGSCLPVRCPHNPGLYERFCSQWSVGWLPHPACFSFFFSCLLFGDCPPETLSRVPPWPRPACRAVPWACLDWCPVSPCQAGLCLPPLLWCSGSDSAAAAAV